MVAAHPGHYRGVDAVQAVTPLFVHGAPICPLDLTSIPVHKGSSYPSPFNKEPANRIRQRLGDAGGLTQFGVNRLQLPPGAWSSQPCPDPTQARPHRHAAHLAVPRRARHRQAPVRRRHDPGAFRLVDTQSATTGADLHVYERAGDLKYGEIEVGQETVIFDSELSGQ